MNIKVLRQTDRDSEPYWQEFFYEKKEDITVAGMLDDLNYKDNLKDVLGNSAPRIQWECSCMQGLCGACAMVINRTPALACETFLRDIKGNTIILEPLRKFPTIVDLIVDRGIISKNLEKANVYIEEYKGADPAEYDHMYMNAKCLKCGLCLEICPNYKEGKNFFGAAFANDSYLIKSRSKTQEKYIVGFYKKHFERGCSKSFSCMDVCPVKIPTLSSIAKMNRNNLSSKFSI